jgi:hypothetical protein
VIFERYKSGKLFGEMVDICPNSSLDKHSFAGDQASIWQSHLVRSRVQGTAKLRNAVLEGSSAGVMLGAGECEVTATTLIDTEFINGSALGSVIKRSIVHGLNVIIKDSIVDKCEISGDVIIDRAEISGLVLSGKMRLTGKWNREPRYYLLENEIANIGITEAQNGHAFIGCKLKPMARWIKGKDRFVKAGRWPREMGDELHKLFEEWLDESIPAY